MNGAFGRIRTSDRLVRSQVLYPAELRTRYVIKSHQMAERGGFEPPIGLQTLYSLSRGAPSASRPSLHLMWMRIVMIWENKSNKKIN